MGKFYITTPIYYVNGKPHIGHAYTNIAADVLSRYHRMIGDDVKFLTGTDEHGKKIAEAAAKNGLAPQQFVDELSAQFQTAWDSLDISHDQWIRTTDAQHEEIAKEFLNKLHDGGHLYKDEYEGLYCVGCEAYKTESELVDGLCPDHKVAPIKLKEENWFFKLSAFNDKIKSLIESGEFVVEPESRRNEILAMLERGMNDIPISRKDVEWAIPLPFDEEQTCYVWIEALMNYVSAINVFGDDGEFEKWWPANVQIMAKDILKFHAIIWPAMLMAVDLPLPKKVFAHGFFTIDGQKISKTIGNVIDPIDWSTKYTSDAVKYFLLREIPFGGDGDVSETRMNERYGSDLANGVGNLFSRVLALSSKQVFHTAYGEDASEFEKLVNEIWSNYDSQMDALAFHDCLANIWKLVSHCDGYIEQNKPWELAKNDESRYFIVLTHLLESLRHIGWMIYPFMPQTGESILQQLGVFDTEKEEELKNIRKWGKMNGDITLQKAQPLFPRIED